jgi:5-methyltetrahydrofolate--homocysteine methyltransferase
MRNRGFIESEVMDQKVCGVDYINVNTAIFGEVEEKHLRWLIEVIQGLMDVPVCIDSPNPEVIEKVLPLLVSRPMVNSITLNTERMGLLLRLVVGYGAKVIAWCQGERRLSKTVDAKLEIAARLVEMITGAGVLLDDLYIEPLAYSLSTNVQSV